MASGGVTLCRIRGIRVSVDFSWFIVLFLIIIWLSSSYRDELGLSNGDSEPYVLAVISALLFFASILLHELGHALVAIRHGIGVSGITLWMFGGVSRLDQDSDSPGTEFKIGIAGPVVTAGIVLLCAGASLLLADADQVRRAALAENNTGVSGLVAMIVWPLRSFGVFVRLGPSSELNCCQSRLTSCTSGWPRTAQKVTPSGVRRVGARGWCHTGCSSRRRANTS